MKKILTLVIAFTMVSIGVNAQSAKTAVGSIKAIFYVDMKNAILDAPAGTPFTPGTNKVDVAGSFNGWGATLTQCTRVSASSTVYTFHLDTLTAGTVLSFKFRIDGATGAWTNSEFQGGGPNRSFTAQAPSKNMNVYKCAYNDTNATLTGIHTISNDIKAIATYPNPAASELNFSYSVVNSSTVGIKLYNIMGAEVSAASPNRQSPGFYKETLDVSKVENGLYFYVLSVNGTEHQSGKIQILK